MKQNWLVHELEEQWSLTAEEQTLLSGRTAANKLGFAATLKFMQIEPLKRIAGTLRRWFEPIVRYIRHRYSNGMTEGFNNKIKLIQRMAYGLRNEHNRRKRILAWCGKT